MALPAILRLVGMREVEILYLLSCLFDVLEFRLVSLLMTGVVHVRKVGVVEIDGTDNFECMGYYDVDIYLDVWMGVGLLFDIALDTEVDRIVAGVEDMDYTVECDEMVMVRV